jgi:hypothetical protein
MKKRTIILSGIFMLLLEYLLLFGIVNIFINYISLAFAFFVYLLPVLTIGIIGILLSNIVRTNIVFFPIHCCIIMGSNYFITGSKFDISLEYIVTFIVLNFVLFFIIVGYITSLLKHLEKNDSSIFINRAFTVLPITSKIVCHYSVEFLNTVSINLIFTLFFF